jgi:Ca2+-binding RTX toxin-like protein
MGTNTNDCPLSDPCSLPEAMNGTNTADGDTVVVLPGDYDMDMQNDQIVDDITVQTQPGQPMAHITGSVGSEVLDLEAAVTLRRLWIEQTSTGGGNGIYVGGLGGGSRVEQSLVSGTGSEPAFLETPSVTLADSAFVNQNPGAAAIEARANAGDTSAVTLRNVTAVSDGGEFTAAVIAHSTGTNGQVTVNARNAIALGGMFDVSAEESGDPSSIAAVNLTASNYDTENEATGGTVTDPGTAGNQTAAPLLDTDGYHQLAGSPTIDAGSAAPDLGSADIDAEQRVSGPAVDIGADELQQAAPPPGPQPNPEPNPSCRGRSATIVGTGGKLNGTPKRDVIVGSAKRDVINAGGGADLVCARGGNDKVIGGAGKDTLAGEAGKDRLLGGAAHDLLLGGSGKDVLIGGGGIDSLRGGPGPDISRQ